MNAIYPLYNYALHNAGANVDLNGGNVKVALIDTAVYKFNTAHEFLGDLSGIVGTPEIIRNASNKFGVFSGHNVLFSKVTGPSVEALVIFIDTGDATTSRLVAYMDEGVAGLPVTPDGKDISIAWNPNGIFAISPARVQGTWVIRGEFNGGVSMTVPASDDELITPRAVQELVSDAGLVFQRQISAIQSGLRHQTPVLDIANEPAVNAVAGDRYIVGTVPTNLFLGHANDVAELVGTDWVFQSPNMGDMHHVNAQSLSVVWNGTTWVASPRQSQVSYQNTPPTNPLRGDCWLDNSGTKMEIKYWDGTSWVTSAGTRTFSQEADPQATNAIHDGDVWVQKFPVDPTDPTYTPTPVTWVFSAGSWSQTTPSVPASSRTYMQAEIPVGPSKGDTWINLAGVKPVVSYYDGSVWLDSGGTRTFVQNSDPALVASNKVAEGDVWSNTSDSTNPRIYQRQAGNWVQINTGGGAAIVPEAPPPPVRGTWTRRIEHNDSTSWRGSFFDDNDPNYKSWSIDKKPEFCPVPAKYKVSNENFRVTIFFKSGAPGGGTVTMTNLKSQFNWADGYWQTNIQTGSYDGAVPIASCSYYCSGGSDALHWMSCQLMKSNTTPATVGDFPPGWIIKEVMVTWELLSV